MSDLFGNTPMPSYMSPLQMILASAQEGREEVSGFQKSFSQAKSESAQADRQREAEASAERRQQESDASRERIFREKQDIINQNRDRVATKLQPIAEAFRGVESPSAAWDVVSQNPQWLVDPDTSKFVSGFLGTQTKVAAAENASLVTKSALSDNTRFNKDLEALEDPSDRAAIGSMSKVKVNGVDSPSPMAWQALRIAQERQGIRKDTAKIQAETEAMKRGDQVRTTISDKGGVTKTFTPDKGSNAVIPREMTFGGVPYIVNPKTGNFVRRDKPEQQLSVAELMREYRTANKDPDANEKQIAAIRAYVQQRFPGQSSLFGVTNAPTTGTSTAPAAAPSTSDDPLGILK